MSKHIVCTGPVTDAGKAIASRNSITHGCCSETLILKSENIEDFKALESTWFSAYSPKIAAEMHLVQELVNADWFLQRAVRTLSLIESHLLDAEPNPLNWTDEQQRTFGRFLRYQTTRSNTVKRYRQAVEEYRRLRLAESIRIEKLAAVQKKNQPEPTWKEHLEGMRKTAVSLGYAPDPSKGPSI